MMWYSSNGLRCEFSVGTLPLLTDQHMYTLSLKRARKEDFEKGCSLLGSIAGPAKSVYRLSFSCSVVPHLLLFVTACEELCAAYQSRNQSLKRVPDIYIAFELVYATMGKCSHRRCNMDK